MVVLNIRLNSRGSVSLHFSNSPGCLLGFSGHSLFLTWSARKRLLHSRQSTIMSMNRSKWPEHFHTCGCMMIDDSMPTIEKVCGAPGGTENSSWFVTMSLYQALRTFR